MSLTHRKCPSMCDGDGFGHRPSKQQCKELEGDMGKSWWVQKARESWSIFCNCSQESVWRRDWCYVRRWVMADKARGDLCMLHLPLGVTALDLEEFLAFMLETETSEQGPRQMRPGEKNSFLWLGFWEAKSRSEVLQRQRCRPCSADGLPHTRSHASPSHEREPGLHCSDLNCLM